MRIVVEELSFASPVPVNCSLTKFLVMLCSRIVENPRIEVCAIIRVAQPPSCWLTRSTLPNRLPNEVASVVPRCEVGIAVRPAPLMPTLVICCE